MTNLRQWLLALISMSSLFTTLSARADFNALSFSGETRARYENLTGQYRAGTTGSDQVLALRTLIRADWKSRAFGVTGELQDSRVYLDDDGTPLSSSFVNPLELLQAKLWFGGGSANATRWRAEVGRMTLDIGSRRQVERNDYRNTVNAYTGAHVRIDRASRWAIDAFYVVPLTKDPDQRSERDANEPAWDDEQSTRRFWGLHGHLPLAQDENLQLEAYLYGLQESDSTQLATVDRDLLSPGLRILKKPRPLQWDADIEVALRVGERSVDASENAPTQDVLAGMLHLAVGYTFNSDWNTRLALELDYASGNDPGSDNYTRYERLFGTRRGDLGNTSIHGPLTRSNLIAPGIRLSFKRGNTDGRFLAKLAYLADAADAWQVARLQDSTGRSGRRIGTTFDFRIRRHMVNRSVIAEVGGSALFAGRFAREVVGGPREDLSIYSYVQITARF
ncbi:MAG: alginate export family protein [Pseudomonadaceae bacterium]|nr:alginate export family protein [Pseudomonadaceae bacterium]